MWRQYRKALFLSTIDGKQIISYCYNPETYFSIEKKT